jgi:hypothetical protein
MDEPIVFTLIIFGVLIYLARCEPSPFGRPKREGGGVMRFVSIILFGRNGPEKFKRPPPESGSMKRLIIICLLIAFSVAYLTALFLGFQSYSAAYVVGFFAGTFAGTFFVLMIVFSWLGFLFRMSHWLLYFLFRLFSLSDQKQSDDTEKIEI